MKATVADYEDARAAIIFAFTKALQILREAEYGSSEEPAEALNAAFDVATEYGWDGTQDEDFVNWGLKATQEEICAEGLVRALTGMRLPAGPKAQGACIHRNSHAVDLDGIGERLRFCQDCDENFEQQEQP